jgi:hypothetical protein
VENRPIFLLFIIFAYVLSCISYANALQDAHVTVDSLDTGICMSIDTPSDQKCDNETLTLEGTQDHVLYILPGRIKETNNTWGARTDRIIIEPMEILFVIATPILGLLVLYIVLHKGAHLI